MSTKKERYDKFMDAIAPYVRKIKEDIIKSPEKEAIYSAIDIAKMMGKDFEKLDGTSLYQGLLFALYLEGIFVRTSTKRDTGELLLVMKLATEEDVLPPHLAKYLEEYIEEKE